MSEIKLRKNYWVVHTDHYGNGTVSHTKQVMREIWRDGKISEEPMSERYVLTYDEFNKAMDAYNWNEVLGEPEDYIRKER